MAQTERFETTSFDGRPAWLEPSEAPTFTYTFVGGRFGIGGESTSTHVLLPDGSFTQEEREDHDPEPVRESGAEVG